MRRSSVMRPVALAGLAVALAAAAPGVASASASKHHPPQHHKHSGTHHKHHGGRHHKSTNHHPAAPRVSLTGLVTKHTGHRLVVFASAERVGKRVRHDVSVHLRVPHHASKLRTVDVGDVVTLTGRGHGAHHRLSLRHVRRLTVTSSPATVLFGRVASVGDGEFALRQLSRDNGRHSDGAARHTLTVNTASAKVTVDGHAARLHRDDLVIVLGEVSDGNVLAHDVIGFEQEPEVIRGKVVSTGDGVVTLRSHGYDTDVAFGSGADQAPLVLNGNSGATTDQLRSGDRIAVFGNVDEEEEGFVPEIGFAFNGHDHGPCGTNPKPGRHHKH